MTMANTKGLSLLEAAFAVFRMKMRQIGETNAETMRRRAAFRRTRAELQALSDRDLRDIGICRGDINRIARQKSAMPRSHS